MENKLNLSQIKKCEQVWNKMELVDGGRLCKKCDKVMIDFRGMDDYEIASIHINSEKVVCGVYDEYRLSDNPNFAKPKLKLNTLYLAGMFGLLANSQVDAKAEKIKTIQIEPNRVSQDSTKSEENIQEKKEEESKILRGIILFENKEVIKGVSVQIKEIGKIVITDENGYFELEVDDIFETTDYITLMLNYVGTQSKSIFINKNDIDKLNSYYIGRNSKDPGMSAFSPDMTTASWFDKLWKNIIGYFIKLIKSFLKFPSF